MSKIEALRAAKSLTDLANLIGQKPKSVSYILFKLAPEARYSQFQIAKRGGGHRTICAPVAPLKSIQRGLADLLQDCLQELEAKEPSRRNLSHGFQRGRSTLTNAMPHKRSRRVFNLDLADFFGAVNFGRVRGYFLNNRVFQLKEPVATTIAQIACHNNCLPQGSPCSPVIANLISHSMDTHLASLAKESGARYSRYADDLTFSSSRLRYPSSIAKKRWLRKGHWSPSSKLSRAIRRSGFRINPAKIRMEIRPNRQSVTGLVVNAKVNVSQSYYRTTRAMCHSLFRCGFYTIRGELDATGQALLKQTSLARLEGRLAHILFVRVRLDRWKAIKKIVDENERKAAFKRMRKDFPPPEGLARLYQNLMNFKYFGGNDLPTVYTEGKTDVIYLREAIRLHAASYPELADVVGADVSVKLQFFKRNFLMEVMDGPASGYSPMLSLVPQYKNFIRAFTRHKPAQPVILLVDNDSGGKKVIKAANAHLKEAGRSEIDLSTPQIWTRVVDNLYLLRTPPGPPGALETDIESLFSAALLAKPLNGLPFDKNKSHGDNTSYGKVEFATEIVRKQATAADVGGLLPLLDAIREIQADLKANPV